MSVVIATAAMHFVEASGRKRPVTRQFTILDSYRLVGVDPREYLADVLPRLTGHIRLVDLPSLLPSRWAAQRASATTTTAATVAQP
jgi:hypothetical protein